MKKLMIMCIVKSPSLVKMQKCKKLMIMCIV